METLFSFQYMRTILATLGVLLVLLVGGQVAQMLGWFSVEPNYATINVEGVAEVTAVPDIGAFHFSVEAESTDVATAQEESSEQINAIMDYLKAEGGVEEKDIKTTGYNTYPRYEYQNCEFNRVINPPQPCEDRVLQGYVVTQSVSVKVRQTDKAGELIAGVGSRGATNMSGLSFEVDDIEGKKEEARLLAIADAKEKAKRLAEELDVRLGDILSFHDQGDGYYPMPYGRGGEMMDMAVEESAVKSFAPQISVGEDEIIARVTITYELK